MDEITRAEHLYRLIRDCCKAWDADAPFKPIDRCDGIVIVAQQYRYLPDEPGVDCHGIKVGAINAMAAINAIASTFKMVPPGSIVIGLMAKIEPQLQKEGPA